MRESPETRDALRCFPRLHRQPSPPLGAGGRSAGPGLSRDQVELGGLYNPAEFQSTKGIVSRWGHHGDSVVFFAPKFHSPRGRDVNPSFTPPRRREFPKPETVLQQGGRHTAIGK